MTLESDYEVRGIPPYLTYDWLLHKHYAHRIPSISIAFGVYDDEKILQGVMTIGKPASPHLCIGVCGVEYSDLVFEFNRLCLNEPHKRNIASYFVGNALKLLNRKMILVSYADTQMGHIGYVYQATNWIYTGITKKKMDKILVGSNAHPRHNNIYESRSSDYKLRERSQKHRYIYFVGNKRERKDLMKHLKYPILPYPKGDNKKYDASYETVIQGCLI